MGRPDDAPDTPGWRVRVVPNLYPAFVDPAPAPAIAGRFRALPARGRHEVVVHGPHHASSIADLDDDTLAAVAAAWQARARSAREAGFAHVHAFVNEGRAAGASRSHTHSQLVWLSEPPPAILQVPADDGCSLCEMLSTELDVRARVVGEQDGLVCICPYASRVPYELLVAPLVCEADGFASDRLASALRLTADAVRRLHGTAGRAPLNVWLHTAPFGHPEPHWHLVVMPRLAVLAGLELGAEIYVNTVWPEEAADDLRRAV
jgi:UDPglucose--hexose-1-phosphate uridylyltransferase